ncbi:hypothetical protein FOZ63_030892, partial [Perkinsus olseni]
CPASQRLTTEGISGDLLGRESGVNSNSPREVKTAFAAIFGDSVRAAGCHGGPGGVSSNFDDWDETTGGGPRRSIQSARRSDDIDDKKSSPKVANIWPNGFWCSLSSHRYSLALLREEIASFPGLNDSYDLLYLPADASKDANRGYAFINLKSLEDSVYWDIFVINFSIIHSSSPIHASAAKAPPRCGARADLLPVGPQEVWGVGDFQMPNEDILQLGSSTDSMP